MLLIILVLVILFSFIGFILFRAFSIKPLPSIAVSPERAVDLQRAIRNLSHSLQIQTISSQEQEGNAESLLAFLSFLAAAYPRVHTHLSREVFGGYSLLYKWEGTNTALKPILLMSHLDVVPVDASTSSQWRYPPFSGAFAEGYIWGRGALDVKSGIIFIMEAIEQLVADGFKPQRSIYIALGHDEESGGTTGNAQIAQALLARGVRLEYTLDEGGFLLDAGEFSGIERPVAMVGIAEKGYLTLSLSVVGQDGHSSCPTEESSIGVLARAITRLERQKFPLRLTVPSRAMFLALAPYLPFGQRLAAANLAFFFRLGKRRLTKSPRLAAMLRTTMAPTMLRGSAKENVLPKLAQAVINLRLLGGETREGVIGRVRKIIDDERVRIEEIGFSSEPSSLSDINSASFALISKTIREVFPAVVVAPFLVVVATDSRYYQQISENTYRFLPFVVNEDMLAGIHGINERISAENIVKGVTFFLRLLRASSV